MRVLLPFFFIHSVLFFINIRRIPLTYVSIGPKMCKDGLIRHIWCR
jgi:hypothetical protein